MRKTKTQPGTQKHPKSPASWSLALNNKFKALWFTNKRAKAQNEKLLG